MSSQRVPILLYHHVTDGSGIELGRYTTDAEVFAAHLDVIEASGCTPLTVSELVDRVDSGRPLPGRVCVITFDDGFADFVHCAWPLLAARSMPATMYVPTRYVGTTERWLDSPVPVMDWDDVRRLDREGVEIGSHSDSHPELDTVSLRQVQREAIVSRDRLSDELGHSVRSFAYPHGFHDHAVRQAVVDAGYASACAVRNALSYVGEDRFALARVTITTDMSLAEFEAVIACRTPGPAPSHELLRTRVFRLVRRTRALAMGTR